MGVAGLNQDKEVWVSRKELEELLQGSMTWADVCSRPAQSEGTLDLKETRPFTEAILDGEDDMREDFVFRELKVTGFLTTIGVLTLVSWVYFVFVTIG